MKKEEIKKWIEENLLMQDEARTITGQTVSGFNQSVTGGKIVPFVQFGERRITRLYLREDMELYRKIKKGTNKGL